MRWTNVAAALPVHDWQFWAATAVCGLAGLWVVRKTLGSMGKRGRGTKATLTIGGAPLKKR